MRDTNTADIITTMNPGDRLFYALFTEPAFINQRLIGLRHKDGYVELPLYHALLNSVLGIFYIEAIGFGRGLGALDINKNTLSGSFMLDPNLLNDNQKQNIIAKFEPLLARNILSTKEELQARDREEFDRTVLAAYGLSSYYENIKESLLSMQNMRLSVRG